MIESHYPKFNKIIDEFERDSLTFSSNKEIISYYPQIFLLSVASTFEKDIKEKCINVINAPSILLSTLPILNNIVLNNANNCSDAIYKKFRTRNLVFDATEFYKVFGGASFKNAVATAFEIEKQKQILEHSKIVKSLTPLIGKTDACDYEFTKNTEICELLSALDFNAAETSFLKLKEKRNHVAHDFISGISDTFLDLRTLYYSAVLYVVAVKDELSKLSII